MHVLPQLIQHTIARLKSIMQKTAGVSTKIKLRFYNSIVKPVLMFNLWTIPARKEQRDRIDRTHRRQLRSVMGHYYKEDEPMVTCQEIYTHTDSVPISVESTERRWTLLGHILRLDPETPANKAMVLYFWKTIGGVTRPSYAGAGDVRHDHAERWIQNIYHKQNEAESRYHTIFWRDQSRKNARIRAWARPLGRNYQTYHKHDTHRVVTNQLH